LHKKSENDTDCIGFSTQFQITIVLPISIPKSKTENVKQPSTSTKINEHDLSDILYDKDNEITKNGLCELPRYYKDSWSPDKNISAEKSEFKKEDDLSQISPIQHTAGDISLDDSEDPINILKTKFSKIIIRGLSSIQIPPALSAISLINIRSQLDSIKNTDFVREISYLTAISLIAGRRFVQACEILRKLQCAYLNDENTQKNQKSWFIKAASLELLIADCMNQHFQLYEKLNALRRACDLYQGIKIKGIGMSAPQKFSQEDVFTTLYKLHPNLLKLLLTNLQQDSSEIQKITTIKIIDFVLENMGCSLGGYMLHILKCVITTYPNTMVNTGLFPMDSFNVSMMSISFQQNLPLGDSPRKDQKKSENLFMQISSNNNQNPNLILIEDKNSAKYYSLYNHLLDTYSNVLGSISSHILHKLFYDLLMPFTFVQEISGDLKSILVKITEKIVAICQGDLIFTPIFLNNLLQEMGSQNTNLANSCQNLWSIIKNKVCPNCCLKSRKQLVLWITEHLQNISEQMNLKAQNSTPSQIPDEELNLKLLFFIDLAFCLLGQNTPENANSMVKIRTDLSDIYLLFDPLFYWLNYSICVEGKFDLFKHIWPCISGLLKEMNKNINIDIGNIFIGLLTKINDHCKHSAPTQQMIQFLGIVLKDAKIALSDKVKFQKFLSEFFENFCIHIPSFPNEEIFNIFDLLSDLCFDFINPDLLKIIISCLIDRYTIKAKKQQETLKQFINKLLQISITQPENNTYFDIAISYCLTNNKDFNIKDINLIKNIENDNKKIINIHEKFLEKLGFLLELLKSLNESHKSLYKSLINKQELAVFLEELAISGHSQIRLKSHETLEIICSYYNLNFLQNQQSQPLINSEKSIENLPNILPENSTQLTSAFTSISQPIDPIENIVKKEQLILAKLVLGVAKKSFENSVDSYMQFNALILMDLLYQNILPVPNIQYEINKKRIPKSPHKKPSKNDIDIENIPMTNIPEMKCNDIGYLNMRILSILKLWPCIQISLNSPWSNIRSITYGLICSMLKIDSNDYYSTYREKLKSLILPVLVSLLSSKESESKAGGLNILGSISGLSYFVPTTLPISANLNFYRKNADFISLPIWEKVFELQEDWDSTIKEAASVLIQLAAPKEAVLHFEKVRLESCKLRNDSLAAEFNKAGILLPTLAEVNAKFNIDENNNFTRDLPTPLHNVEEINLSFAGSEKDESLTSPSPKRELVNDYFYIEKLTDAQLKEIVSIFRNDFKPPKNLWIEKNQAESLLEYDIGDLEDYENCQINAELVKNANKKPQNQDLPFAESENHRFQIVDNFEDKLVENLAKKVPETKKEITSKEKIPEKVENSVDLKKKDSLDAEPYKFLGGDTEQNQDILEIIDIEDEDFLKSLEDDKVPVLKNTYADKKSKRPSAPRPRAAPNTVKIDLRAKLQASNAQNSNLPKNDEQQQNLIANINLQAEIDKQNLVKQDANEIKSGDIVLHEINEDISANLVLKKGSNSMRPANGLRPITPPLKNPEKTEIINNEDIKGKGIIEDIVIIEEEKIPPINENEKSNQSAIRKENEASKSFYGTTLRKEEMGQKKLLNKSFDNYQSARLNNKAGGRMTIVNKGQIKQKLDTEFPLSVNNEEEKKKPIKKIHKVGELLTIQNNSSSLPTTPTGTVVQKKRIDNTKSPIVTNLFKDLKVVSKKKHKRQPQQHLAQTSPALVAILKSIKETTKRVSEESSVRSERTKPGSKKIVIQAKLSTPKTVVTPSYDSIKLQNHSIKSPTLLAKTREKSRSQAEGKKPHKPEEVQTLSSENLKIEENEQGQNNNNEPMSLLDNNQTY